MSTITAASTELKPSDVLAMSEGDRDELADGRLVELDVGSRSQYAATLLTWMLMNHCKPIGLAHVLMEAGYTCFPGRPNQMRRPDVTCIRADRLPFEEIGEGFLAVRPDLVVEAISPNDRVYDLEEKLDDYRAAGVPLIWLIYPPSRRVRIVRAEGAMTEVGPDGEPSGEDVLPAFGCGAAELFAGPARRPATTRRPASASTLPPEVLCGACAPPGSSLLETSSRAQSRSSTP